MCHELKRPRRPAERVGMVEKAQRAFPRIRRRLNCDVTFEGNRHVGVVTNLSPSGFFIQTGAAASVGSNVSVTLRNTEGSPVDVEATVTNRHRVPPRLASIRQGGLGCKLQIAPEEYYQLLGNLGGTS